MRRQFFIKIYAWLSRYAAEPGDSEEWRLKKIIGAVNVITFIIILPSSALRCMLYNEVSTGLVCIGAGIFMVLGFVSYVIFRSYALHWYYWMITLLLATVLIHILLGGFVKSGMIFVWMPMIPIATVVAYKPRHGFFWFIIVLAIFLLAAILEPLYIRETNNIPSALIKEWIVINILGVGSMMFLSVYYYARQNDILHKMVLSEQKKSESLLLNILPKEIAATLKNENRVIADHFDGVSVLFADVVNFTPLSAKMTPTELVELLNEVFSSFDTLVEKYGLEKIKTIGDCYMAAAGVPGSRLDHAHTLAHLALDIRDYVNQHEFRGKKLALRIGINSGPVVAGVIGHKKFSYDLWGDTVNTASRMESQGSGGFIQVTEATYGLIKDDFICEPRGVVSVKGKGDMNVWYVLGNKGSIS